MNKKFTMKLPEGYVEALHRRHNGSKPSKEFGKILITKMNLLYKEYTKIKSKLNYLLNVEWDEKRIEENYGTRKFYGAHIRLRNLEKKLKNLHSEMFYLLLKADGNSENFCQHSSISAEEVYEDFNSKYNNEEKNL